LTSENPFLILTPCRTGCAALAIAWAQVKEREEVFIVSHGISDGEAKKLGFIHFGSAQAALDEALRRVGPGAKVAVLTHAPDMLPIIGQRSAKPSA
jgi:hypothetical protein